ncbi:MAG: zinc metalloprotease HtpX [bacterium]
MNTIKVVLLLASLSGLLMVVGYFIGRRRGVIMALGLSMLMNIGSYWYSDKIVLKMYNAREVTEEQSPALYHVVTGLSERARLPMPGVYIIDSQTPNAFATGRNENHAAIAVTSGILNILDRAELEGVIGHELSHIKNKDMLISTMAATIAGGVVMLSYMARWAAILGDAEGKQGGTVGLIATAIVAPIAATIIQMAISRSREYGADEGGAKISGKPAALARALAKLSKASGVMPMDANPSTAHMFIVNPLSGDFFLTLFDTHPPIEERIDRLMKMSS